MRVHWIKLTSYVLFFLALPHVAFACEPIIPLTILFGAPLYSLFGIVILKAVGFACIERSIPVFKSALFVVAANLFSSLIGILLTMSASAPTLLFFVLPFVYGVSITPAKRLVQLNQGGRFAGWSPYALAAIIAGLYFLTFVLFGISQTQLDGSLTFYWSLKYLYVLTALSVSIFLTTLWEEWVIAKLSRSKRNFMLSVLKVNLVSFLLIMAVLAAIALPKRFHSKGFLIQNSTSIYQSVSARYKPGIAPDPRTTAEFGLNFRLLSASAIVR
ncbi:MAG: hypothetical protein D3910_19035 [Candidatus Electrothrix sp. ATG2]|nr:hypothetical protein [Candidatus Electrothrix sp. ATG2]